MFRDRGNARGETAGKPDEHQLDRRRTEILGGEHFRMIDVERKLGLVLLLFAKTMETLHGRLAVCSVLPLAGRPPLELRGLGRCRQRFPWLLLPWVCSSLPVCRRASPESIHRYGHRPARYDPES